MAACKAMSGYADLEKFTALAAAAANGAAMLAAWIEKASSAYAAFQPVALPPEDAGSLNAFAAG